MRKKVNEGPRLVELVEDGEKGEYPCVRVVLLERWQGPENLKTIMVRINQLNCGNKSLSERYLRTKFLKECSNLLKCKQDLKYIYYNVDLSAELVD